MDKINVYNVIKHTLLLHLRTEYKALTDLKIENEMLQAKGEYLSILIFL